MGFAVAFIGGLAWLVAGPIPGPVRMVSPLGAMFILATAAGVAYRPRPWRAHLCPWGTIAGLIAARSRYRLTSAGNCSGCERCVRVCPADNLDAVPETGRLPVQSWVMCVSCVVDCPRNCPGVAPMECAASLSDDPRLAGRGSPCWQVEIGGDVRAGMCAVPRVRRRCPVWYRGTSPVLPGECSLVLLLIVRYVDSALLASVRVSREAGCHAGGGLKKDTAHKWLMV